MSSTTDTEIAPNAKRLLWAGFMAILAAGVGFAIRGGILDNWGGEYGFTALELGAIGGAGFTGFCFGIIVGGVIVDKIGYGWLVVLAFALHVLSALVTFATGPDNAYTMLYLGMFLFAYANGTLEAVANPLVATLFPNNRTHYLNILHASWPAGMILGSMLGWVLDDRLEWHWKYQLALYLVPTLIYGVMFLGQSFPKSEASEKGLRLGEMLKDVGLLGATVACFMLGLFFAKDVAPLLGVGESGMLIGLIVGFGLWFAVGGMTGFSIGSVLLFVLFATHALVGAVELGTDGWIQNITGNLFTSEQGKWLFIWTSSIMFGLRFAAHWIEKNLGLSPVGLLFVCSVLAVVGLQLASGMETFTMALIALGIYAVGKTFFWPTMLAVASDRYPRTGAVAISIMGGIGMLSAGMIGGPGLGYAKDRFAADSLRESNPALYASVKNTEKPSQFLIFESVEAIKGDALDEANNADPRTDDQQAIVAAGQEGDRQTLKADSAIPAAMAVIYLLIMLYFKSAGGYKIVTMDDEVPDAESEGASEEADAS